MFFKTYAAVGCLVLLCGAVLASAQTDGRPAAGRFVDERLAVWQHRLKLDDWRISVRMVRQNDLPPKTLGGIRWDRPKKSAEIWVLDAADYRLPEPEMLQDMEQTIVHELVHLDLASLPRGQASRSSEERAVNGIAQTMLELDRRKN